MPLEFGLVWVAEILTSSTEHRSCIRAIASRCSAVICREIDIKPNFIKPTDIPMLDSAPSEPLSSQPATNMNLLS